MSNEERYEAAPHFIDQRKEVIAFTSVILTSGEATTLETFCLSHMDRDRCDRASRIGLCLHGQTGDHVSLGFLRGILCDAYCCVRKEKWRSMSLVFMAVLLIGIKETIAWRRILIAIPSFLPRDIKKGKSYSKHEMRGFLHYATHDETVSGFGRNDDSLERRGE
jgi:hypothetical protein